MEEIRNRLVSNIKAECQEADANRGKLSISLRSRFSASASTDILQSSTVPEVTSMKLSIPNPPREMLPASNPETMATRPSRVFHPIVKYSRDFPRCAAA